MKKGSIRTGSCSIAVCCPYYYVLSLPDGSSKRQAAFDVKDTFLKTQQLCFLLSYQSGSVGPRELKTGSRWGRGPLLILALISSLVATSRLSQSKKSWVGSLGLKSALSESPVWTVGSCLSFPFKPHGQHMRWSCVKGVCSISPSDRVQKCLLCAMNCLVPRGRDSLGTRIIQFSSWRPR